MTCVCRPFTQQLSTIADLEKVLLKLYPAQMAEPWDKTGLLVGDPEQPIEGICVALDATVEAVQQAVERGANVLVTHHPAFIEAPSCFKPANSVAVNDGALVYWAAKLGVALMNFHTALDFSPRGGRALPEAIGLEFKGFLAHKELGGELEINPQVLQGIDVLTPRDSTFGYGSVCALPEGMTAGGLAEQCEKALGRKPRLWGNPDTNLSYCVTAGGSGFEACHAALKAGINCVVVGELKYHDALALMQAGLSIVELGHDVSELPLADVLLDEINALVNGAVPVSKLDQNNYWE